MKILVSLADGSLMEVRSDWDWDHPEERHNGQSAADRNRRGHDPSCRPKKSLEETPQKRFNLVKYRRKSAARCGPHLDRRDVADNT